MRRRSFYFPEMIDPVTPVERTALLVWLLANGRTMTAPQVATLLSIGNRRARSLLCELSRVVPIYRDDNGLWRTCNGKGPAASGL